MARHIILAALILLMSCSCTAASSAVSARTEPKRGTAPVPAPGPAGEDKAALAQRYIRAYPDFFVAYKGGYLVTKDGGRILFDDGKAKDFDGMIVDTAVGDDAFDPEDALHWDYPAGEDIPTPEKPPVGDPGRIRPAAVFEYMYGSTAAERKGAMRDVQWVDTIGGKPKKIRVTTVNGVDKALTRVSHEIMNLPDDKKKALEGIVYRVEGPYGYYERPVRDFPGRTSGHAYGIAVDINGDLAYFAGGHKGEPYLYRNNVPRFLVEIFEKNGFIWGGRWHSYDAMHFEYRPELLMNGQSSRRSDSSVNCPR
ncbi:MAG TPA: M15 family metallopeptidase [Deltaproteobacteria bacterium]|jgi:hypothetical protein|nr:M15 family metallopeptidase [Deltaproteobacteria bacterium]HQH99882.1 M15 family metallopeptidase [Deltaproteobacteria bacterium]HQJ09065.1 M15 family metallopeptidase [Deltaproteobacteria bacterium]